MSWKKDVKNSVILLYLSVYKTCFLLFFDQIHINSKGYKQSLVFVCELEIVIIGAFKV